MKKYINLTKIGWEMNKKNLKKVEIIINRYCIQTDGIKRKIQTLNIKFNYCIMK